MAYFSGRVPFEATTMQVVEESEVQVRRVFDKLKAICRVAGAIIDDFIGVASLRRGAAVEIDAIAHLRGPEDQR